MSRLDKPLRVVYVTSQLGYARLMVRLVPPVRATPLVSAPRPARTSRVAFQLS